LHTKSLVILAIGLAGLSAQAWAQSYPPGSYPARGPYHGVPLDDDDLEPPEMVGPPGARPLASTPFYESQPLPPPGANAQPAAPPPAASAPYRNPYAYDPMAAPRRYMAREWEPLRPPGEIYSSRPSAGYSSSPYASPSTSPSQASQAYGSVAPQVDRPTGAIGERPASGAGAYAALPPDYRPEEGKPKELSPHLQRQVVTYPTPEPAGTIIIDTPNTFLYLVLGDGKAMRYGIGVGREGFTWSGVERVSRMAEWPDWHPPPEMIERQPYLPRFMAGGESNPLGARALYLGKSIYRIHGTNQPSTIGTFVSSGCIRLTNTDIEDLYRRVAVGTKVVVLTGKPNHGQTAAGNAELPSSSQVIR